MDSSSVASHVVGMVKGVTTSFVIDMGIVLQVNSLPHFGLLLQRPVRGGSLPADLLSVGLQLLTAVCAPHSQTSACPSCNDAVSMPSSCSDMITQLEHRTLQGNTPDLLPEQLLGTIRFSNLDLRLAKHLDPVQHRQLSRMASSTGSSGRQPTSPPPVAWPTPGSGPSRLSSVGSGHLLSMAEESSRQHRAAMRNGGSLGSRMSDPAALEQAGRQTFWGSPQLTPQPPGSGGGMHAAAAQMQHHSNPQPTGRTTTAASDELFSMKYDGSRALHRSEPHSSHQRSDGSLQRRRSHSDGARHS